MQYETPRYKIVSFLYTTSIDEECTSKDRLLLNYKKWVKGVDDVYQVLADANQDDFNAKYYNGLYTIVLGEGKGKSLEGKLQVSYCTSVKIFIRNHGLWLFS